MQTQIVYQAQKCGHFGVNKTESVVWKGLWFKSDGGTAFTPNGFKEYCKTEGIAHTLITAGIPRADGQVKGID